MASSSSSSPLILPLSPNPSPTPPSPPTPKPYPTFLKATSSASSAAAPTASMPSLSTSILPILSVLREHDLPEARISKLLKMQPGILMLTPLRVNEIAEEVKAAGVRTSNPIFVYAFRTVAGLKRVNRDRKMAVFESFGLSEAKIRRSLEFFLRRLKLVPEDVVRHPILLKFSLEKRILPRCAVVKCFKEKGEVGGELERDPGAAGDHVFVLEEICDEVSG